MRKFPKPTKQEIDEGLKRFPFRSRMEMRVRPAFCKPLSQRKCRRRSTFLRIGRLLKRWHATLSRQGA